MKNDKRIVIFPLYYIIIIIIVMIKMMRKSEKKIYEVYGEVDVMNNRHLVIFLRVVSLEINHVLVGQVLTMGLMIK